MGLPAFAGTTCRGSDPLQTCFSDSQRDALELMQDLPPGGRGECRVPSAPAASCAHGVVKMHTSIHSGRTGNHPASPHAMVLTAYAVLSPATNSSCHRRRRITTCPHPVGPTGLRRLDTSNGCQDHTVLPSASAPVVLRARSPLTAKAALRHQSRPTLPRPPHPAPRP